MPEKLRKAEEKELISILDSGLWVLGSKVKEFENKWASYTSSEGCVGVGNGVDALEIGMRIKGVSYGDEIITPSLTAYPTIVGIQKCGAKPVFADIDPSTALIDLESVKRCLSKNTKGVIAVHLYGQSVNLAPLKNFCDKNNLFLAEDCAQAHGCKYKGSSVGNIGDFAAWSFYPTKNLGASGDAGALTSNKMYILEEAARMRNYGQSSRYCHDTFGLNSRLDEIQAGLLLQRIEYLDIWNSKRREIAFKYWRKIKNPALNFLQEPKCPENHVHHLFVLKSKKRNEHILKLKQKGIDTLIHYKIPSHLQKANLISINDPYGLKNTELHCKECFSLPLNPFLEDEEVDYIIDQCNLLI